ncbi:MAG: HDOD domain-containing protein [Gemmatimonadaceae bacterium]|nr:HDOD domain-containing protein [Gemmatimonadaceae bacterium]
MLGDLFKRYFAPTRSGVAPGGSDPGGAPATDAPRATHGATSRPLDATDGSAAAPLAGLHAVPRDADAREMQEWLELDIRTRIGEVSNVLGRADRETDAPRLLDALLESFEAVVRQPPLAAQRALSVTRDVNAPTSKLVTLVESDPGLGQALLRYANSAYYATAGGRVVSLHGAVQRVGTSGVHNVVLRTMVDGMLCRPGSAYQDLVNLSWQHMVRVAPITRSLSPAFRAVPDEAYALGLLHDVGKLVIFDRLGELRKSLRREVKFPSSIVSVVLRMLHEPLGGLAALQWGLGAGVSHAIATHHRSPVPEMYDPRCELLYLAERIDLARVRGRPVELERWWKDGLVVTPLDTIERGVASLPEDVEEPVLA